MSKRKIAAMILVSGFVISSNAVEAKHRSDMSIFRDIDQIIDNNPNLDDDVNISVNDGYVTLDGTVDTKAEKDLAQKLLANLAGVHQINNRLYVEYNKKVPNHIATKANNDIKTDKEIYEDIERRLFISSELNSKRIRTSVTNGKVTFTGTVDESSDLRLVEQKARDAGATRVINMLGVSEYKASL